MRRAPAILLFGTVIAVALSGCGSTGHPAPSHPSDNAGSIASAKPRPEPDPVAGMTLAQLVGQVFMVGTTAGSAQSVSLRAVSELHVGNVFLSGRSHLGVAATAAVVGQFRSRVTAAATARQPLLVATDEEGGEVQVLSGPGFATMPTGVAQGKLSTGRIRTASVAWGASLSAAGVNMNLAPVVDLVASPAGAATNPPIGVFRREIGFAPGSIVSHANAFRAGMASSHVLTVLKHFPGLGHVTENTDTSRGVVDTTVTSGGADLGIYRAEIAAGAPCIMVSSAVYSKLDPSAPAIFSRKVVTDLLRGSLGFTGVIISDDLSAAAQIDGYSPGTRAIDAISAGDDIVLISSRPDLAAQMTAAVLAKAEVDPAFAATVKEAARRVVELKHKYIAFDYPDGGADPREANQNSAHPFL
ncbi:MAG TPA: glycoside hydrolase family 3 N-terminal domain-containing protein [Galbitalea sp.]|nr:glycoside hydrolase family 3 N-terminal domain-containing protein [Galbitalea sp.]